MRQFARLLLVFCLWLSPLLQQAALGQGSAITYQGRLTDGGAAANGVYDFRFILYDAAIGGSQVGNLLMADDVPVSDGNFTTLLDFGADPFNGQARWLEIAVRSGTSTDIYTTLDPRQRVTTVPYAIHAAKAASVTSGAITAAHLAPNAVTTAHLVDGAITGAKLAPGSVTVEKLSSDALGSGGVSRGTIILSSSPTPPLGFSSDPNINVLLDSFRYLTAPPHNRPGQYVRFCHISSRIYSIGDRDGNNRQIGTLNEYDPTARTWEGRSPIPTPRFIPGVAVLDDKIYVIGGETSNYQLTGTNEEYDAINNTWQSRSPMPTPRRQPGLAAINGKIYAIGGLDGSWDYLNTVEEYNPSTDTWQSRAPMPTARGGPGVTTLNGRIYVIGGVLWNEDTFEEFNPETNEWRSLPPSISIARNKGVVGAANGKIYFLTQKGLGEFDPSTRFWRLISGYPGDPGGGGVSENVFYIYNGGEVYSMSLDSLRYTYIKD